MDASEKRKIKWTKQARLQLVEAVIKIEEQMRNESNNACRRSSRKKMPEVNENICKWNRIANLLPPEFRGGTWKPRRQGYRYKCFGMFCHLLQGYRDKVTGKDSKRSRSGALLSKTLIKLLKKREDLGNIRTPLSATRNNSLNTDVNQGHSSRGRSIGTASEQAASLLPENTNKSENREEATPFDNNAEEVGRNSFRDHQKSREPGHDVDSSLGCTSWPLTSSEGLDCGNKPAHSTLRSSFRCLRPQSKACPDMAEPSTRPGVQTRSRSRTQTQQRNGNSFTRSASNHSRASGSARKRTSSMPHTRHDEHLQAVLYGQLDLEFSRLSSWVESRAIPAGKEDFNAMMRSSVRSSNTHKFNFGSSKDAFNDDLVLDSHNRMLDLGIKASFQKLRVQFAEELKNASVKVSKLF